MDINLKNACVIFDEGHNVADVAMVIMVACGSILLFVHRVFVARKDNFPH